MENYILSNGVEVPKIGFGTWQMSESDAFLSVQTALEIGYRHIDTASAYGNEETVGQAVKSFGLLREEIFLTTKLNANARDFDTAIIEIDKSLSALDTEFIDLLLIHWPNPLVTRPDFKERNAAVWQAMEKVVRDGKVRAIGVSNFQRHHLEALMETAEIAPVVNQIYCNPSDQQEEIQLMNHEFNLLTEAYSPLGTGEIFKIRALEKLTEKYDKSVAQIVLRWHIQKGYLPLPKSVSADRIRENFEIFDFQLSAEDVRFIDSLHGALTPHKFPDTVLF